MATQVGRRMFPRWHLCFDVYCGVKRHAVWGKTKTCLDWLRLCMCVCVLEMYLYMSVSVCDGGECVRVWDYIQFVYAWQKPVCLYERLYVYCACDIVYIGLCVCVCCSVWWHLLRCWLGAEHSGPQEPQTKEMKAEVTTWTSGTRHTRSHNTQIQSHTCKPKDIHTECTHTDNTHTHSKHMSPTHSRQGGHTSTQGRETKAKIKQLSRQNNM